MKLIVCKNRYILFITIMGFFNACAPSNDDLPKDIVPLHESQRVEINLKNQVRNLSLDTLLNTPNLELIPLQTSNESIFASAKDFSVIDKKYLISDFNYNKVLLFDESGNFMRSISKVGKGPGEHLSIFDLNYNPFSKTVDLHDHSWRFFQYDIETGRNISARAKISADFHATYFFPLGKDSYLLYNYFSLLKDEDQNYRVAYLKNGKILWKKYAFTNLKNRRGFLMNRNIFYRHKDSARFFERFIPVIYNVTEKGLFPLYYFDFGNGKLNDFNGNDAFGFLKTLKENDGIWLSSIFESNRYLFVEFGVNHDQSRAFSIVKKADRSVVASSYAAYYVNGVKIYPKQIIDNVLYAVITPEDLINKQKELGFMDQKSLTSSELKIKKLKIKVDDNLIILKCGFKN